ncbi:hypothetical protein STEG23_016867, partial [Scotinomys teguina]
NASLTSCGSCTALLAIKKLTSQQNKWAKPWALLIEFDECVSTIEKKAGVGLVSTLCGCCEQYETVSKQYPQHMRQKVLVLGHRSRKPQWRLTGSQIHQQLEIG